MKPFISIIIPCRNEERFIDIVLKDIIYQDYPKERLEVFFIDGLSTDRTREIINKYISTNSSIHLIDNAERFVPYAMNMGIKKSKGDLIVRMDAHASFPLDYISKLAYWIENLQADNVGCVWITVPSSTSLKAKAIAAILSNPFGVGNAMFRIGVSEPMEVDTVPFGCYRKSVFENIGMYDERLIRNQDIELNKRLKAMGGKIFLVPDISIKYFARDTFRKLIENNFKNGEWVILTAYFTNQLKSLSLRHFIPLLFVLYLLVLLPLFHISLVFLVPILLYLAILLFASFMESLRQKNILILPFIIYGFLVLHLAYGAGSIFGIFRLIAGKT